MSANILLPSKLTIRDDLTECFHVSSLLVPSLDKYYVLHWESKHLFSVMINGTIEHDGIIYQVCYHPKHGPAELKKYTQVKISFRKLGNMAYAVIRPIHETRISE